jgi:hypothetical protein
MTTSIPDLSGNTAGVTVGDPKTASEDNVNVVGSIDIAGSGTKTAATSTSVTPASDAVFPVKAAPYTQLGDQQILSATLAASTGLTVPTGATVATIQNNGTGICRWRPNGVPTATLGQTIAAGATLTLDDGAAGLAAARFIIGSGTVNLDICYFS